MTLLYKLNKSLIYEKKRINMVDRRFLLDSNDMKVALDDGALPAVHILGALHLTPFPRWSIDVSPHWSSGHRCSPRWWMKRRGLTASAGDVSTTDPIGWQGIPADSPRWSRGQSPRPDWGRRLWGWRHGGRNDCSSSGWERERERERERENCKKSVSWEDARCCFLF